MKKHKDVILAVGALREAPVRPLNQNVIGRFTNRPYKRTPDLLTFLISPLGDLILIPLRTLYAWRRMEWCRVWTYAHDMGARTLPFVGIVMACVGVIMVVQSANQALRIIGDLSPLGPIFLELLVREMGPAIVALMVCARCGASLAAEAGMLVAGDQLDALRLCGSGATTYLFGPSLLGGLLVLPALVFFGTCIAYGVGGIAAHFMYDVGWGTYFDVSHMRIADPVICMVKASIFGLVIPVMAIRAGINARGGSAGVGHAATVGVIGSSVMVLACDFFVGTLAYLWVRP